jgi:GNAT superfamily N-acetyltransferase
MTDGIGFVAAGSFSLEALADIVTRSFEAYFYQDVMTAEALARRVREEQIDLWASPVMLLDGAPAGQALIAVRGERAWCGGFGMMRPLRGRGLAHRLAAEMLQQARAAGARSLALEVLTRNEPAIRTYTRAGLRVVRDLRVLEWAAPGAGTDGGGAPAHDGGSVAEALVHFHALHPRPAAWQRDLPSLLVRQGLECVALARHEGLAAYALLSSRASGARIEDIGAISAAAAAELLTALRERYPRLISVNEPADSPLTAAFDQAGFAEVDRQHEMTIEL